MALDALLAALTQEAERAVEQMLTSAHEEAARLRSEAEAQVEQRCADAITARASALRASAEVERAHAQKAAAVRVVQSRDACLDRVFRAAEEALERALDSPDHAAAPGALAAEALEFFSGVPVVIRCRTALVERVRTAMQSSTVVSVVADDALAPGVVEAADHSVIVDNTVERACAGCGRCCRPSCCGGSERPHESG
jgi:vacuolar-type H+-ATPase subunit E/Vma4